MSTPRNFDDAFVPGDLVLFAGQGLESRWIALVTCDPLQLLSGQWLSHIGICGRDPHGRTLLFESTTLCDLPCQISHRKTHGTQAHLPEARIDRYSGKVWRLRLAERETLTEPQSRRLSDFLLSEIGKPYDYAGAMISATWRLRFASCLYPTMSKLFCSYYVMAALKDIGKVDKDLNPRAYNPARVARNLQVWGTYQPLGLAGSQSVRLK
ncbi:MAG TPA: hypothetical protein VHC19_26055 [Pirellulales bacterium]|nr:hypothetical protein [Pirellulales bacterium]